ncbi:hypothetical protein B0H14DRAFT_3752725 [Mycena olivaceomarginata]|nr:hypothetical protein B0H14DRAFT_3752725 [Mycena olivaceomarginata]
MLFLQPRKPSCRLTDHSHPKKTDSQPLGLFNVNEGSKKGIIKMLKVLQEISGLPEEEWVAKAQIVIRDWLTSNNIWEAHKDQMDDIYTMERLDYVDELSALWHFALNITHMIMQLHFRDSVLDPGSLAKHKGSRQISNTEQTSPNESQQLAQEFVNNFTITINAENAKIINDNYYAHSLYFICDALIFSVFEHSVAFADAGGVLRVLKYWALSFRGAGLHNYARECLEILLQWKYKLTPEAQAAKDIPNDLYLEWNNLLVKRVKIAKSSGVTVKYIIEKGSAPVKVFQEVSHQFARTFGFADRARRHKEADVGQDLRLLTETMRDAQLHVFTPNRPIYMPLKVNKKGVVASGPQTIGLLSTCTAFRGPVDRPCLREATLFLVYVGLSSVYICLPPGRLCVSTTVPTPRDSLPPSAASSGVSIVLGH